MPRPARFTDDDILDAALACVRSAGPGVTVADIAAQLDGPVGSIYHRFASREVAMVRLWVRSVQRFQAELFKLAEVSDAHQALLAMAVHIPRYCRAHPAEAVSLTLYRQDRLLMDCPDQVHASVETLNEAVAVLSDDLTRRRYGELTPRRRHWVSMATRVAPYGLVRPYLGGPVPDQVDDAVAAAADAILRLDEESAPASMGLRETRIGARGCCG